MDVLTRAGELISKAFVDELDNKIMASNERAIVNNLNERARFFGGPDAAQLTIYDVRRVLHFFERKSCQSGEPATSIDHVKPLSLGGENIVENLQVLTKNENKAKGDKEIDYRKGRICPADYSYESDEMENEDYSYETGELENGETSVISSYGGARSRSGRKPKELTILKRRMIADKAEEAEASFGFLVAVRDNPSEPTNLRLVAAQTILDRVFGRATERSIEQKQITIKVIREAPEQRNSIGPSTYLALGAGTD
jgi:hypothetical protein